MIDWLELKIGEVQSLVVLVLGLLAIIYIGSTWWKTKALVPTVTAMVLAGAVLWGVGNVDWFRTKVAEETAIGVVSLIDSGGTTR